MGLVGLRLICLKPVLVHILLVFWKNGFLLTTLQLGVGSASTSRATRLVCDEVSAVCCGGAGVYAMASGSAWFHKVREHCCHGMK